MLNSPILAQRLASPSFLSCSEKFVKFIMTANLSQLYMGKILWISRHSNASVLKPKGTIMMDNDPTWQQTITQLF